MAEKTAATTSEPTLAQTFSRGLLEENPSLRQMLGLCPTLAVTTAVTNGLGMGMATTFVLVCSGVVVSLLRKVIPSSVRIPSFITIIASFVTLVMMLVKAYLPALDEALGIYLPLMVVNCIVLGRAEMFASNHGPVEAAADGLDMCLGFTVALTLRSAVREIERAGTFQGVRLLSSRDRTRRSETMRVIRSLSVTAISRKYARVSSGISGSSRTVSQAPLMEVSRYFFITVSLI
jgi:electron transport complex protein RnfE